MAYETNNPYNGDRVQQFAEHTDSEVEIALARAHSCFTTWRKKTFAGRAAVLSKAAQILRSRAQEFASLTLEMGNLIAERRREGALSADIIDYHAQRAEGFLAPQSLESHSGTATTLRPLCSEAALPNCLDQVKRSIAAGARLLMGSGRVNRAGALMQPSILTDIKKGTLAYVEEFFGPVALFFRVANEKEAIALANDSKYGLGGSVFTADIERGKRVASQIETGIVSVNHPTWTAPELPFGGIKDSG